MDGRMPIEREIEPLCYSCVYAKKRGYFRLCNKGHIGYRIVGEKVICEDYLKAEEDA